MEVQILEPAKRKKRVNRHWDEQDILAAFLTYRLRITPRDQKRRFQQVVEKTGIGAGSLAYTITNFEYLDGIGKVYRYSAAQEKMFNDHRITPLRTLVSMVENPELREVFESRLTPQ